MTSIDKFGDMFDKLSPAAQNMLLEGPSITPPHGVEPNFVDPPNSNMIGWMVAIVGSVLCVGAMAIRMYNKIFYVKKVKLEDCMVPARPAKES